MVVRSMKQNGRASKKLRLVGGWLLVVVDMFVDCRFADFSSGFGLMWFELNLNGDDRAFILRLLDSVPRAISVLMVLLSCYCKISYVRSIILTNYLASNGNVS